VAEINRFRRGAEFSDGRARDHGQLWDLSLAQPDFGKCMNEKAASDLYYSVHQNAGCGHFTMSLDCGLESGGSYRAENSCCPGSCSTYAGCKEYLLSCLQGMWDEGQIVLDTGRPNMEWKHARYLEWTMQTGHYWNMISSGSSTAACGFGFNSEGKVLATQNFF